MKRLVANLQIGDKVKWKKHPYDTSVYEVIEILDDASLFIDNGKESYTSIKPSVVEKI